MDVRDVVRAYRLLIEQGKKGQAYNVASKERMSIQWILDALCEAANVSPTIEVDPELYRPTDRAPLLTATLMEQTTGWKPEIPFRKTLTDILEEV